jgi:predicted amidohydrolase
MPRKITIAAVQMDIHPAPTLDRLERAECWVIEAAQAGVQLVVLPELFNTGYAYTDANYRLSEPIDGMTGTWMKKTAGRLGIHLAGSFMLREQDGIYNSMLLFSPTGQQWRYDKNYPWAWERGYFRERRGITVAHTTLGDLGMMLCWDAAHPNLWKQYAGRVDMLVMASCPPDGGNPTYRFPDGSEFTMDDFGAWMALMKEGGRHVFGDMIGRQTAWLGVPTLNTGGSGHFQSSIPRPAPLVWGYSMLAPRLVRYRSQAGQLQMSCDMIPSCRVFNAQGKVVAERTQAQGEGFALSEVVLAESKPLPRGAQPPSQLSTGVYFMADVLVPFLVRPVYRKGLKTMLAKASPSAR